MVTPNRLQRIDDQLLSKHHCLNPEDECYFFGEYAGRMGCQHSPMNQLIFNFKKPLDRRDKPDWQYKGRAIKEVVTILTTLNAWDKIKTFMWVPMPSSKTKEDPAYDDRLTAVLQEIAKSYPLLNIREILINSVGRISAHDSVRRPTVDEHYDAFKIDTKKLIKSTNNIIIFDDVITTGASFKAAQRKLKEVYPDARVIGIFIARSVIEYEI